MTDSKRSSMLGCTKKLHRLSVGLPVTPALKRLAERIIRVSGYVRTRSMSRRSSRRKGSRRQSRRTAACLRTFDRDGDAGTAKALEDALAEIVKGEGQCVIPG